MHKNTIEHFKDTRSILYNSAMDNMCQNPQNRQQQVWPLKPRQLSGKRFCTESAVCLLRWRVGGTL